MDTELMKWLNCKKKKKNENEIKKILKLKKQNDIKLEDIICNIYNFFNKIFFM